MTPPPEWRQGFETVFKGAARTWKLSDANIVVQSGEVCAGAIGGQVQVAGELIFERADTPGNWKITLKIDGQALGDPETVSEGKGSQPLPVTLIGKAQKTVNDRANAYPWQVYKAFVRNWKQKLDVASDCTEPGFICSVLPLPYNQFLRLAADDFKVRVPVNSVATQVDASTLDKCDPSSHNLILVYKAPTFNAGSLPPSFKFYESELTTTVGGSGKGCGPQVRAPAL